MNKTIFLDCVAAEPGDVIMVSSYDEQDYAWDLLDALGKNWAAGEPDAVLVHARVAGEDAAKLTDWIDHKEEQS